MKKPGAGWRRLPFLKILAGLVAGILLEYYLKPGAGTWAFLFFSLLFLLLLFFFLVFFRRYRWLVLSGIAGFGLFISMGGILLHERNIMNDKDWFGTQLAAEPVLEVLIEEPPVEKPSTFRYLATVRALHLPGRKKITKGKIFIYLKKDSSLSTELLPGYGTRLLFKKIPEAIQGNGNPGGFDYGHYCRMKGITHQVFISFSELKFRSGEKKKWFKEVVFNLRDRVLAILRKNIRGEKELGLAEALLIGYKQDLDKSLVKDYSDTGVVHIIAISGLHVGLVYWLLAILLSPLKKLRMGWLAAILTIAGLWLFSFLGGAQPSLLRAALMFSCMVIERQVSGRGSSYNTIAFSAFVLLCIDPHWLWDAGFQLSFAAVISIIAFMKPVYSLLYFRNRIVDAIWKMNAVTLAAQVLTFPVCIYYFHQFPVYFLVTNFIAVPLSTVILFGEILLIAISFVSPLALLAGRLLGLLIGLMNDSISLVAGWPHATWESLYFTPAQAILLTVFAAMTGFGWIDRTASFIKMAAGSLLLFSFLRTFSFHEAARQTLIIVYNAPRLTAVDLVAGRNAIFIGDSILREKSSERELYLDDSRTYFRTSADTISSITRCFRFRGLTIWVLDETVGRTAAPARSIDLLILSGEPRLYFKSFAKNLEIKQVVMDGNVPAWKKRYWKKDCDSLGIPWHDVTTHGAFVMRIR